MLLIRCFTRYENLNQIRRKLFEVGAPGVSISEAQGIGKPLSQMVDEVDQRPRSIPQFKKRICVEIVIEDAESEEIVSELLKICNTGLQGDGKIFILPVNDAIRIRTGERGDKALY